MNRPGSLERGAFLLAALAMLAGHGAQAESLFRFDERGSRVGEGSISFGLHASRGDGTFSTDGVPFPAGDVDTRAVLLGLSYRFAERWTAEARLPYVRRRHTGFLSHDPALLQPPRLGLPTIDSGDWHGGLQDFGFTLRYDAIDEFMLVRPFVGVSIPMRNYPFFGNSAIGTRLHRAQLGVELVRPIGLSDFYWRLQYAYEIIERSYERINTNAHLTEVELGWYAGPRWRLRGFVSDRAGKGLPADADFGRRTNLRWYYHDQNSEHSATVAGLGVEYALSDRWSVSAVTLRLIEGKAVHRIRLAGTLELIRHFGRGH
jgi:hypothetical protein